MSDHVTEGINAHLQFEVERLTADLEAAREMLARPINVHVAAPPMPASMASGVPGKQGPHLAGMDTKLGMIQTQLGNISTNASYIASAVQSLIVSQDKSTKVMVRIAEALEALAPEEEP